MLSQKELIDLAIKLIKNPNNYGVKDVKLFISNDYKDYGINDINGIECEYMSLDKGTIIVLQHNSRSFNKKEG